MARERRDENLAALIQDLYELRGALLSSPQSEQIQELVTAYLIANADIIDAGVAGWLDTPEDELHRLLEEHTELDSSAASHGFHAIGVAALSSVRRGLESEMPSLWPITDDNVHMLDRVLNYAKYVADTSGFTLRGSPLKQLLADERALRDFIADVRADVASAVEPDFDSSVVESVSASGADAGQAQRPDREQVEWVPDVPARQDLLNRQPLAAALARRLRRISRDAGGSFLIHLDGAWGAGKTSILNFLRDDLEAGADPWLVAEFNAWQQAHLGPAWWTLMTVLRRRIMRDLRWRDRIRFRVAELWQRARRTGAPYALPILMLIALVVGILFAFGPSHPLANVGNAAKTVTAVVTAIGALWAGALLVGRFFLWESPAGARVYERSNENPMSYLNDHFGWLVSHVGRPVAFFIDDLDRCDQAYVVDFLDTIQTLVRDASRQGPYFIVAADGGWIRASYDVAYAQAAGTVVEPGQTLGHLFLDKLFQLTATIPLLSRARQALYLKHLLRADGDLGELREERERVEERIRESTTQSEVREIWANASPAVQEAVAPAAVARLTDEDVEQASEHELEKFAALLDLNPRRMKRFLNVYTMDLVSSGLEGNFVSPDTLALWTILRMRWPRLADHLRAQPSTVGLIGGEIIDGVPGDIGALIRSPEVAQVVSYAPGGPLTPALVEQLSGNGAAASAI